MSPFGSPAAERPGSTRGVSKRSAIRTIGLAAMYPHKVQKPQFLTAAGAMQVRVVPDVAGGGISVHKPSAIVL
jgi:hypothetical protein